MNFTDALNSGNEGLYWLHEIKRMHPSLPVVLFTAYADINLAVRGIKEGATEFVVKPWDNAKFDVRPFLERMRMPYKPSVAPKKEKSVFVLL